ncbi:ribosomal protein S10 [Pseudoscourfieldia marina]
MATAMAAPRTNVARARTSFVVKASATRPAVAARVPARVPAQSRVTPPPAVRGDLQVSNAATAEAESETALKVRRLRVTLKAYTSDVLNEAALLITEAAKLTDAIAKGPTALPTKTKRFCVLRSPHVNKKSREHFEIRTHKKIVDIMDPSAQTIDALMQLDMPSGCDVQVKLL